MLLLNARTYTLSLQKIVISCFSYFPSSELCVCSLLHNAKRSVMTAFSFNKTSSQTSLLVYSFLLTPSSSLISTVIKHRHTFFKKTGKEQRNKIQIKAKSVTATTSYLYIKSFSFWERFLGKKIFFLTKCVKLNVEKQNEPCWYRDKSFIILFCWINLIRFFLSARPNSNCSQKSKATATREKTRFIFVPRQLRQKPVISNSQGSLWRQPVVFVGSGETGKGVVVFFIVITSPIIFSLSIFHLKKIRDWFWEWNYFAKRWRKRS